MGIAADRNGSMLDADEGKGEKIRGRDATDFFVLGVRDGIWVRVLLVGCLLAAFFENPPVLP